MQLCAVHDTIFTTSQTYFVIEESPRRLHWWACDVSAIVHTAGWLFLVLLGRHLHVSVYLTTILYLKGLWYHVTLTYIFGAEVNRLTKITFFNNVLSIGEKTVSDFEINSLDIIIRKWVWALMTPNLTTNFTNPLIYVLTGLRRWCLFILPSEYSIIFALFFYFTSMTKQSYNTTLTSNYSRPYSAVAFGDKWVTR